MLLRGTPQKSWVIHWELFTGVDVDIVCDVEVQMEGFYKIIYTHK